MDLGTTITRLRTQRGLSQGDLAEALEVSRQSVSKWETNASTPDLDKLVKLSRFFGSLWMNWSQEIRRPRRNQRPRRPGRSLDAELPASFFCVSLS